MTSLQEIENNSGKPEWGGWRFVSEMLDKKPDDGIYQTSECYQKLYEFVCTQKQEAIATERARVEACIKGMMGWKFTDNESRKVKLTDLISRADLLEALKKDI